MNATIEVDDLAKRYGATVALDGLSFSVTPGHVTGLAGPEGAGKTTAIRVILGLDAPDRGTALVCGRSYHTLRTPLRHVGTLLDAAAVHPSRRARDHLRWMVHANGLPPRRVDEALELAGLGPVARRRADQLSPAQCQRLGLAAALLGDPPVLLLDQPPGGLDAEGAGEIHELLRSLAAQGRVVLVCGRQMRELEGCAEHLIVIGRGRLIADTSVRDLVATASRERVVLRTPRRSEAMTALAHAGGTVAINDKETLTVAGLRPDRVAALLADHGLPCSDIAEHRASLEEAYMELTRAQIASAAPMDEGTR
jgi:ABC-2 type transport system ATP-binding protein